MNALSLLPILIWSLATVFGVIGFLHILGPRFLRDAFENWNYGTRMRLITGLFEVAVAVMLLDPEMRAWGIGIAAVIMFAAVITLLNHEQYLCAIPSIVLMIALVPASLAVPPGESDIRFASVQTVGEAKVAGAEWQLASAEPRRESVKGTASDSE